MTGPAQGHTGIRGVTRTTVLVSVHVDSHWTVVARERGYKILFSVCVSTPRCTRASPSQGLFPLMDLLFFQVAIREHSL